MPVYSGLVSSSRLVSIRKLSSEESTVFKKPLSSAGHARELLVEQIEGERILGTNHKL